MARHVGLERNASHLGRWCAQGDTALVLGLVGAAAAQEAGRLFGSMVRQPVLRDEKDCLRSRQILISHESGSIVLACCDLARLRGLRWQGGVVAGSAPPHHLLTCSCYGADRESSVATRAAGSCLPMFGFAPALERLGSRGGCQPVQGGVGLVWVGSG